MRRQPFAVWVLDNVGPFGVKRVRPELQSHADEAVRFCRRTYRASRSPSTTTWSSDDEALYCVEMTEKAYRSSGLPLSEPVRLGDMENAPQFPICMFMFQKLSTLTLEQAVFFPGNERHGIWSCSEPGDGLSAAADVGVGRPPGAPETCGQRREARGPPRVAADLTT